MAVYGYINYTLINERDDRDISAVFNTVPVEHIIIEQMWTQGENIRPAFEKMLNNLQPGDILYISSIDRLGLNADDAVRMWNIITEEKKSDIVILDNAVLDSRRKIKPTLKQLENSARSAFNKLAKSKQAQIK